MNRYRWIGRIALVAVALAVVGAIGVGCKSSGGGTSTGAQTPASNAGTALAGLEVAKSALSTSAPDAKLLVVQTAQPTTPTATPVWAYLFGSPKTDKVYLVLVTGGKAMGAQEYATAKLTPEQWKDVPEDPTWQVDSDQAYIKALEVSGAKGDPNAYMIGLITYKSPNDTSTVQPFVWNVQLDPGASGATTMPIDVDAKTGKATVQKKQ